MEEMTAPEEKFQFNKKIVLNILLLLVILVPLNYALFVIYKGTSPSVNSADNTNNTSTNTNTVNTNTNTNTSAPAISNTQIQAAEDAVKANPGWNTYLNLGLTYYYAHDYPSSIQAYQKAIQYNPKSPLVYSNMGVSYGAMGKWEEQIKYCSIALQIDSSFQLARNNITWAKNELAKKAK